MFKSIPLIVGILFLTIGCTNNQGTNPPDDSMFVEVSNLDVGGGELVTQIIRGSNYINILSKFKQMRGMID